MSLLSLLVLLSQMTSVIMKFDNTSGSTTPVRGQKFSYLSLVIPTVVVLSVFFLIPLRVKCNLNGHRLLTTPWVSGIPFFLTSPFFNKAFLIIWRIYSQRAVVGRCVPNEDVLTIVKEN
jgi:hypothetical protein